jgi:hypothetical protein
MIRIIEGLIGDWWHLDERIEYVTKTAICARSSCKAPALFCSDRQTGQSTASDRGSQPRRNACITMFWQPHWPTN